MSADTVGSLARPFKPKQMRWTMGPGDEDPEAPAPAAASLRPQLSRPAYYSNPSIQMMSTFSEKDLSRVDNLEIGRHGVGSIKWTGLTDVRRMNFDEIVFIDNGEVTVYPDPERMPPKGEGLNKEAVIHLNVRPSNRDGRTPNPKKLEARMKEITERAGHVFIRYDGETWIFQVHHFVHPT